METMELSCDVIKYTPVPTLERSLRPPVLRNSRFPWELQKHEWDECGLAYLSTEKRPGTGSTSKSYYTDHLYSLLSYLLSSFPSLHRADRQAESG